MTKANKEILITYRKLQKEFDLSKSYPDWISRRCKVLADTSENVSARVFRRLADYICK